MPAGPLIGGGYFCLSSQVPGKGELPGTPGTGQLPGNHLPGTRFWLKLGCDNIFLQKKRYQDEICVIITTTFKATEEHKENENQKIGKKVIILS